MPRDLRCCRLLSAADHLRNFVRLFDFPHASHSSPLHPSPPFWLFPFRWKREWRSLPADLLDAVLFVAVLSTKLLVPAYHFIVWINQQERCYLHGSLSAIIQEEPYFRRHSISAVPISLETATHRAISLSKDRFLRLAPRFCLPPSSILLGRQTRHSSRHRKKKSETESRFPLQTPENITGNVTVREPSVRKAFPFQMSATRLRQLLFLKHHAVRNSRIY
ncbi:hypothetical protein RvY_14894-2 [Ramazzottius varieornatus]|uniref:Uncharacterized protein n=1 Tax=Ramazzottius varieornatus TaxID=947166 RepID=A0A1D1VUL0_RAMVA|nr:hypothetical protein RvY_14894-2 [Ramazzottius varieornatus]